MEELRQDFATFAKAQIETGDIDPMYPVLKRVYEADKITPREAIWRTMVYVGFYHIGSAEKVWRMLPEPPHPDRVPPLSLPTGVERRGFRGNTLVSKYLRAVAVLDAENGGLDKWAQATIGRGGQWGWRKIRVAVENLPLCGPWASYKTADLLAHTHGLAITADDIGVGGGGKNAGPVPGLTHLTGATWQECAKRIMLQLEVYDEMRGRGVPFIGLEQFETALCDFNSLLHGRYYVGHDIDDMMDKLAHCPVKLWRARLHSFPPRCLGEMGGWRGVRKHLNGVYANTREIIN